VINELDKDKKEKFYSYLKSLLKGRLEEKRNDIYEILEVRFGNVPEDIKEVVEK